MKIYTKIVLQWLPDGSFERIDSEWFDWTGPVAQLKKGSSPPPPPDYAGAATAQGQANLEAARASSKLSNPNIITPYGSQTVQYGTGGDQDIPTVTQSYSPEVKALMDQNIQVQQGLSDTAQQGIGNVQEVLGSKFDTSNLPQAPINAGQTAQEAIMARLQPQIERRRQLEETQLTNQGIPVGSEAYTNAQRDLGQQENDLYTQAALQGINLDTSARQNALQEQAYLRNLPLNEVTSLLGSSQVQGPTFQGFQGSQVQSAPIFGATEALGNYNSELYNAKAGQQSGLMGGLFGLGSAAISKFSDRRLKRDIALIGKFIEGINLYFYRYLWSDKTEIGFMADEVEKVIPSAVSTASNGYKMVNYGKVIHEQL